MTEAPKVVVLELEDKDVEGDVISVLNSMETIRREELVSNRIGDNKKNEYLHLAVRLASGIEALADEKTLGKMDFVVKQLDRNPALMAYDYLQDGFWRESEPEFTRSLDQLLIGLKQDSFSGLEDKHHLLNALKYLGSKDEELKKRLEIYDTILPFNTPSMERNRKLFLASLEKYGKIDVKNGGLKVREAKDLDKLLNAAGFFGFSDVDVVLSPAELNTIEKKYNPIALEDQSEVKGELENSKFAKAFGKIKFLTYPILGNASGYVQRTLENKLGKKNFDGEDASPVSCLTNVVGSILYLGYGAFYAITSENPVPFFSTVSALSAGVMFTQEMVRTTIADSMQKRVLGNLTGKILFSPLDLGLYLKYGRLDKNEKNLFGINLTNLRSPEDHSYNGKKVGHNYHVRLEELAQKQLPDKVEDNLTWSLENHHTQGKRFKRRLYNAGKIDGFQSKRHLDRELGALTLYDVLNAGPYQKTSAIVCFKGKRYVMTYVTGKKENDFNAVSNLLSTDKKMNEKISELSSLTDAEYLHLTEYANGGKEDLTATK